MSPSELLEDTNLEAPTETADVVHRFLSSGASSSEASETEKQTFLRVAFAKIMRLLSRVGNTSNLGCSTCSGGAGDL